VKEVNPGEMLPGVHEFLLELQANGVKIGLGSSSKNAVMILEKLGIYPLFDTIIDGTKIHFGKPHPEVFLKGAKELGLDPSEVVVFEDAISGVDAAVAGGFYCVGIGDATVLKSADIVVRGLHEVNLAKLNSWYESANKE
jgi:beta-phosphoglucomutase